MIWSRQQDAAMKTVDAWLTKKYSPFLYLAGYAGTGKTTLAKYLAQNVKGTVLFASLTGKAALVLRQKGCPGARTIHQLIYLTKDKSRLRLRELEHELAAADEKDTHRITDLMSAIEKERENLARPSFTLNTNSAEMRNASLVIIDECSMVDSRMGEDLLSFDVPILVLGDPAQLPPVRGAGFFTSRKPDIMLTDIHRQAKESPVIYLATETRQGRTLSPGDYGDSKVVEGGRLDPDFVLAADQVLVGRNVTRCAVNSKFRTLLKYDNTPLPMAGDRLVCLRNDHEVGVLNGSLWTTLADSMLGEDSKVFLSLKPYQAEGDDLDVEAWTHPFLGSNNNAPYWERSEAQEFAYGYALTVHKSQGSEWRNVIVYDESKCFRADRWKHLYTAITRAAEQVTVVR